MAARVVVVDDDDVHGDHEGVAEGLAGDAVGRAAGDVGGAADVESHLKN